MLMHKILIAMNPISNFTWKTVLLGSTCASILSGIAVRIIHLINARKPSDTINEVLFYGTGNDDEKKQLGLNNLFCLYYVLIHARYSVDISMPSLNSDTISKCLINVHQKNNAKIRIVLHKNLDLDVKHFLDKGIEVKVMNRTDVRLEHEFALIDADADYDETLAIIGSLDYEVKRVNCDSDSTILTSNKAVVATLKREFDRIWNSIAETE